VLVGAGAALAAARREAFGTLLLAVLACAVVGVLAAAGGRSAIDAPYGRILSGALATAVLAVVGVVLAVT
jgi:hypothetical protein